MKVLLTLNVVLTTVFFRVYNTTFTSDELNTFPELENNLLQNEQSHNFLKDYVKDEQDLKLIANKVTNVLVTHTLKQGLESFVSFVQKIEDPNLVEKYFNVALDTVFNLIKVVTEERTNLFNEIQNIQNSKTNDYFQLEEKVNESYNKIAQLTTEGVKPNENITNESAKLNEETNPNEDNLTNEGVKEFLEDLNRYYENVRVMELEMYKELMSEPLSNLE